MIDCLACSPSLVRSQAPHGQELPGTIPKHRSGSVPLSLPGVTQPIPPPPNLVGPSLGGFDSVDIEVLWYYCYYAIFLANQICDYATAPSFSGKGEQKEKAFSAHLVVDLLCAHLLFCLLRLYARAGILSRSDGNRHIKGTKASPKKELGRNMVIPCTIATQAQGYDIPQRLFFQMSQARNC